MTNRANAFRAEHAIRDGDLVKLKLEVGRNAARTSSSLQPGFLSVSAFADEADLSQAEVREERSAGDSDFQSESVFRIEVAGVHRRRASVVSAEDRMAGADSIYYGQAVRLVHVQSESYLAADKAERCVLLPAATSSDRAECFFFIKPRYKMRTEGQPVYNSDRITLTSRLYPTVNISCDRDRTEGTQRVGLSTSSDNCWVIEHFSRILLEQKQAVRGGDSIRLWHPEAEGFINVRRNDDDIRARESPLQELLDTSADEKVYVQPLEQAREKRGTSTLGSSRSIFQLELQEASSGEVLREGRPCRLRSVYCGKYLYIHQEAQNPEAMLASDEPVPPELRTKVQMVRKGELPPDAFEAGTLFEMINADKQDSSDSAIVFAKGGTFVYLAHLHSSRYLRVREAQAAADEHDGSETGFSRSLESMGGEVARRMGRCDRGGDLSAQRDRVDAD